MQSLGAAAMTDLSAALLDIARAGQPSRRRRQLIAGFFTPHDARLFAGMKVRLSIIDVNDPRGRFHPPAEAERKAFFSALAENGIGFVRRYSGGADIHAACGMLACQSVGGVAFQRRGRGGENGGDAETGIFAVSASSGLTLPPLRPLR